jgi:flagella basal body P-ring formation protein FlgA
MNAQDKLLALSSSVLLAALTLMSTPTIAALPASAQNATPALHAHSDILQAAIAIVQSRAPRAQVDAQTLDPRVQLRACAVPLDAEMPLGVSLTARINVRVRCTAPAAWSLIVPVTVHTETAVWVANMAIRADEKIRHEHLRREVRRFPGTDACCIKDQAEVLGKVLRRPIAASSIVQRADIETADVVKRGEIVTIVAGSPALEVRASGVALSDAKPGEPVRIRHSESLRIVQARADTEGVVRVP